MTTKFIESGTSATGDFSFWSTVTGNAASSSAAGTISGNANSVRFAPTSSTESSVDSLTGTDSGRVSFYALFEQFDSAQTKSIWNNGGALGLGVTLRLTSAGVLQLTTWGTNVQIGSDGPALALGRWYRICIAWTITNSTTYSVAAFVDGVSFVSVSNSPSLQIANASANRFGVINGSGSAKKPFFSINNIYNDDSNSVTDTGDVCVTTKSPAALNVNNFDTLGGSGANRYNRVSDRPLSITNYIEHAGASDVQENFGLQDAQVGDISVSAGTLIARTAWVYAARGALVDGAPSATGSGAANSTGTTVATSAMNVAAGDLVVVAVADQMGGANPTLGDSVGGNTWTALSGPTTNTIRASKWFSIITNGGAAMVVTATFGSANASRAIAASAWPAAMFGATPLDKNVTNANDSTTPFTCPTSGTLAQAIELVLGFTYSAGSTGFTATSPNLLAVSVASSGGAATTNAAVAIGYQLVAATTAVAPVFAGTSRTSVQGTASYKVAQTKLAGTPKLMDNGSESAIVLTASPALYTLITDSASYPSNAAGIGMRSSGAGCADTFFYEGGTLIAYKPLEPLPTFNKPDAAVMRAATW